MWFFSNCKTSVHRCQSSSNQGNIQKHDLIQYKFQNFSMTLNGPWALLTVTLYDAFKAFIFMFMFNTSAFHLCYSLVKVKKKTLKTLE